KGRKRRAAHLSWVAIRDGDANACRAEICDVRKATAGHFLPERQTHIGAPHLQFCCDAEHQSILEELLALRRTKMCIRVEEAGQESLTLAINYLRGRRDRDIRANGANHTTANEDSRAANHARAIEHVYVAEHERLLRLLSRGERR